MSKHYSRLNLISACAITFMLLTACKSEELVNGVAGTGGTATAVATATPVPTGTPVTVLPASYDGELYFTLSSAWDQAPAVLTNFSPTLVDGMTPILPIASACLLPFGQAPAPGNAAALTHTCNFQIPEAQMYFSNIRLKIGSSDPNNCRYLKFYPYFYEVNGPGGPPAIGSAPPAGTAIPWTVSQAPPAPVPCFGMTGVNLPVQKGVPAAELARIYSTTGCYNGPATLIANFPFDTSLTSESQYSQEITFAIPSASSGKQLSNRWTSNDSVDITAAGASVGGEYFLSSMHSYVAQCLNSYGVLTYQTKITIGAVLDAGGAAATSYKSWR